MRIPRILRPRALKARKRLRSLHYFAEAPVTWEAYISGRAAGRNRNERLWNQIVSLREGMRAASSITVDVQKAAGVIARWRDER